MYSQGNKNQFFIFVVLNENILCPTVSAVSGLGTALQIIFSSMKLGCIKQTLHVKCTAQDAEGHHAIRNTGFMQLALSKIAAGERTHHVKQA